MKHKDTKLMAVALAGILVVGLFLGCAARDTSVDNLGDIVMKDTQGDMGDTPKNASNIPEDKTDTPEKLSTEEQIKRAALDWLCKTKGGLYHQLTSNDIIILKNCGTYNGAVVMLLSDNKLMHVGVMESYNVAGINYSVTAGKWFAVCKDDQLFSLSVAYTNGILAKEDIQAVIDAYTTE